MLDLKINHVLKNLIKKRWQAIEDSRKGIIKTQKRNQFT